MIIENPAELIILNKYEQEISYRQKRTFLPFTAFEILNEENVLSDNYTLAMAVRFAEKLFYFKKQQNGDIQKIESAGYVRYFKNVTVIGDTIQITSPDEFIFHLPGENDNSNITVQKDELLIRIFYFENQFYFYKPEKPSLFGWANLSQKKSWQIYTPQKIELHHFPDSFVSELDNKIKKTNHAIAGFFTYFNSNIGTTLPVPFLESEINEKKIVCKLKNSNKEFIFKKSMQKLVEEIKLIKKSNLMDIQLKDNEITIRLR